MECVDATPKSTGTLPDMTALPEHVDLTSQLRGDRSRRRELLREKHKKLSKGSTLEDAEEQELASLDVALQSQLAVAFNRRPRKSVLAVLRQEKREAKQKSLYGTGEVPSRKQKKHLKRQAEKAPKRQDEKTPKVINGTGTEIQRNSGSWTFGNSQVIISNRAAAILDSCRVYTDSTASILPKNQLVYFTDASGPPPKIDGLFHGMSVVFKENPETTEWRMLLFAAMDTDQSGINVYELIGIDQALKHAVEITDTGVNGRRKISLGEPANIKTTNGIVRVTDSPASTMNIIPNYGSPATQVQAPSSFRSSDGKVDLMTLLLEYMDLDEADTDHDHEETATGLRISEASQFKVVKIFTDSQFSLLSIRDHLQGLDVLCSYTKTCRFNVTIASIAIKIQVLTKRGIAVEFRWVPGHSKVPGNTTADRASRAARHMADNSSSFEQGKNGKMLATGKGGVNASFVRVPIGFV